MSTKYPLGTNKYRGQYLTALQEQVLVILVNDGGTWHQGKSGKWVEGGILRPLRKRGLICSERINGDPTRLLYSITSLGVDTLQGVRHARATHTGGTGGQ